MSDDDYPRPSRIATVEEDDDEEGFDTVSPELSASANVAAKRTKPALGKKGSYERKRSDGNDSGYASRAGTVASRSPPGREKVSDDLTVEPAYPERESRPYSYSATKERPPRPSSRPPPDRTESEQSGNASAYRHKERECWICDKYGKHIDPPEVSMPPPLPKPTHRLQREENYEEAEVIEAKPRMRRTSSYRAARPVTMYAEPAPKMIYPPLAPLNTYAHEAPAYSSASWQPAYSTTVQYAPMQYTSYATVPLSTRKPPPASQTAYTYATISESRSRPTPPSRRLSMHSNLERPVIKHRATTSDTSSYKRAEPLYEERPPLRTHKSSRDEEYDRHAMPPPPLRPPIKKAATSTILNRRSMSHESTSADVPRSPVHERAPPSSYKGPASPIEPRKSERYEAEAEAYQRSNSTPSSKRNSLTAETLSKVPKAKPIPTPRSETDSSQRSHKSSSRGSSGSKNDITMTINGIALTIPKVGQRVTVSSKGMNISVGGKDADRDKEQYSESAGGARERAPSVASRTSSKDGPRGREAQRPLSVVRRESSSARYSARRDEDGFPGYGA